MLEVNDLKLKRLRLRHWQNLHFQKSAECPMHLIQVERLDELGQQRTRPLWLAWVGIKVPALCEFWQLYLLESAIDHWYRFAKQRLHWTLPKLSTPEQCERSS